MKKKKVVLLMRGLSKGGVFRTLEQLLFTYKRTKLHYRTELIVITDSKQVIDRFSSNSITFISTPKLPKLLWDYLYSIFLLSQIQPDIVIYSKNIIPFTHSWGSWEKRLIIYDLAFMHPSLHAYKFFDSWYMQFFLSQSLKLATHIFAISNFTKSEIMRFFGTSNKKISVMHLGVDPIFSSDKNLSVLKKNEINTPFIFYCGSLSPRKNIKRVLQAFGQIQHAVPHNLYLISGSSWGNTGVEVELGSLDPTRVKVIPFLTNLELVTIYKAADLLVYPSLYEGFGLPIIEAQFCGCPVLTSNKTSCIEILGEYPLSCDPTSVNDIAFKMQSLLVDKKLRQKCIDMGKKNSNKYNWLETTKLLFQ